MQVSGNLDWARSIYPRLPEPILAELVEKLAAYAPKSIWSSVRPALNPKEINWVFPFFGTIEEFANFDHLEYETWVELAEQDLMKKHNLTSWYFCDIGECVE